MLGPLFAVGKQIVESRVDPPAQEVASAHPAGRTIVPLGAASAYVVTCDVFQVVMSRLSMAFYSVMREEYCTPQWIGVSHREARAA